MTRNFRGVAQLVEHWSPKPGVAGSSPVSPAKIKPPAFVGGFIFVLDSQDEMENELKLQRSFSCAQKTSPVSPPML